MTGVINREKGTPIHSMKKQWRLLVIGSILVVIVVGAIILRLMTMNHTSPSTSQGKSQGSQNANKQQLVDEVNKKYGEKDYSGAIQLIEGRGSTDDPSTQLLLAGAYANAGDIKKALDVYKKLDAAGTLPKEEVANAAEMAERAGDYKTAIAYYKRAKANLVGSKTESPDQAAVYDYKIAELGKKL